MVGNQDRGKLRHGGGLGRKGLRQRATSPCPSPYSHRHLLQTSHLGRTAPCPDQGPRIVFVPNCHIHQCCHGEGWDQVPGLSRTRMPGGICPVPFWRLAALTSASMSLLPLALFCKWAPAQAKHSAGIRPGSQTLNWSWALHYLHTCSPAPYGLR